jgi:acetolactate synthase small subunit
MNKQTETTIVQFDGEKYYVQVANLILLPANLSVKATAIGRNSAVDMLKQISAGKIKPDIAIVDTLIESNHTEGEKIAQKLRALVPEIKIIAYTLLADEEVPWADVVAVKSQKDPKRTLIEAFKTVGVDLEKGQVIDRS